MKKRSMLTRVVVCAVGAVSVGACLSAPAHAQVLAPEFARNYLVLDVGGVPGVPPPLGGLTFKFDDVNTLLIGGTANLLDAKIYAVTVIRDENGHISGFGCGEAIEFAAAPGPIGGGIDGGLIYSPEGVLLYTTFNDNALGQIPPGEVGPTKFVNLDDVGISGSTGTLRIVPKGFPGEGQLKIASFGSSLWYTRELIPDGKGTYDLAGKSEGIQISGGPEGIVYVAAGNPGFPSASVLVSRWGVGDVVAYDVDANGDPIPETERLFLGEVPGAEGAVVDPLTGDFLFSTFGGGERILVVQGFTQVLGCRSDLDGDGFVDGADLGILLSVWGTEGGGFGDILSDCIVDGGDLGVLLTDWGSCS